MPAVELGDPLIMQTVPLLGLAALSLGASVLETLVDLPPEFEHLKPLDRRELVKLLTTLNEGDVVASRTEEVELLDVLGGQTPARCFGSSTCRLRG